MSITLTDEQEIKRMMDSRQYWILVGNHHVYAAIEEKFYPDADGSFMSIMGPPPGEFAKLFTGMMVLHFARKDKMSGKQLVEFMETLAEREGLPKVNWNAEQDIVFLVDHADGEIMFNE